jgi:regulator of sirC expression with transglutaminase-like and TPR domain
MPAYCHSAAYAAFAREMPHIETSAGLFRGAFAIARHERPNADVDLAWATVGELSETVRRRVLSPRVDARLAHLHDVLFDVVGFKGNVEDYYNPANSYLSDVLQTRRGLPITLALIYKCVAEGIGLTVCGINSPGHFLAAVQCDQSPRAAGFIPAANTGGSDDALRQTENWMYVDPFHGGELLNADDVCRRIAQTTGMVPADAAQWLGPASHRQWLSRMLYNLQAVFAHTGRERDLFAMQELQDLLVVS